MAAVKKPPDRPGGKFYKCHGETRFDSVICLPCEDVYHLNDFIRRNCGTIISETLAICKNHTELSLTSNSGAPLSLNDI